ncbi:MAG: choice-of-anchor H family protein [Gammaproteobacteria bacterium]|nr:choice-of-anchor H family protein [Gammaproteobacteria bacterium]
MATPTSAGYSIYDAYVDFLQDDDADGFHHRFAVNFDADTSHFSADVYARLYLSYQGGAYYHYYTTATFTIDGSASDDDYEVTTTLTSGYPTGYYDVAIDLYEAGSHQLVASSDAYHDTDLATLPLEDLAHESGGAPGVSLFTGIVLFDDLDYDGYFHRFALDIDVDMPGQSRTVYARIDVRVPHGAWLHEHTTAGFLVDGVGPHDIMRVHSFWESGYPPGRYDFRVGVYDASTHALIAENGPSSLTLTGVPLEDAISDHHINPTPAPLPAPGHGHTVSHGHGGSAASGVWALLALSMGLLVRIRRGR